LLEIGGDCGLIAVDAMGNMPCLSKLEGMYPWKNATFYK